MQQVSLDSRPQASEPLFFAVSTRRLVVMSLATFGIYEQYWFYKNWVAVRTRSGEDLMPFWRAVFPIFWCRSLFKTVEESAVAHGVKVRFNPEWATGIWFGFGLCRRLPAPFGLLACLRVIPVVLVQRACNDLNRMVAPTHAANDRFSVLNIVYILLVVGLLIIAGVVSFSQH